MSEKYLNIKFFNFKGEQHYLTSILMSEIELTLNS